MSRTFKVLTVFCLTLAFVTAFTTTLSPILAQENGKPIAVDNAKQVTNIATLEGHKANVLAVAFNKDGTFLASGGEDTTVRLWDINTKQEYAVLKGHDLPVDGIAFGLKGDMLFSRSGSFGAEPTVLDVLKALQSGTVNTIQVWDIKTKEKTTTLKIGAWFGFALSPDGQSIATSICRGQIELSASGITCSQLTLKLIDANKGKTNHQSSTHIKDLIRSMSFSPDGAWLAVGSSDGTMRLLDTTDLKKETILFQSSKYQVLSVAFSPDGSLVAAGIGDGSIEIWDVKTGKSKVVLKEHTKPVMSVAFSPDGTILASGNVDKTIHLWDVEKGTDLVTLSGNTDGVWAIAFSPDGTLLASGSDTIRLWGVPEQ